MDIGHGNSKIEDDQMVSSSDDQSQLSLSLSDEDDDLQNANRNSHDVIHAIKP